MAASWGSVPSAYPPPASYSQCPSHGVMVHTAGAMPSPMPSPATQSRYGGSGVVVPVMTQLDDRAVKDGEPLLKGGDFSPSRVVPGITHEIKVDDNDCTIVVVFPRDRKAGGTVDSRETIEDAMTRAKSIFCIVGEPASETRLNHLEFIKEDTPCTMADFQADIRSRFLEILEEGGLQAEQFPSIDGDEDFLKVYLHHDTKNIRHMAENLEYPMPYKEEKYKDLKPNGPYEGRKPAKNKEGEVVVAFGTYTVATDDYFQDFKFIDTVRILEQYLAQRVSLEAMQSQGVMLKYFPCPKADEMVYLFHEESNPRRCSNWSLPGYGNIAKMKDYFGEEIAFLYYFYAYLIRSLSGLAVGGGIYFLVAVFAAKAIKEHDGYLRTAFCVALSIWATMVFQVWGRKETRICQAWGCEARQIKEADRSEWDYKRGENSMFVNSLALGYVVVYAALMECLLSWSKKQAEEGEDGCVSAFLLTAVIKGGSFAWGKVAPALVSFENLRTENQYQRKLAALLAGVKIFVALWPLVAQCFLAPYNDVKCYTDVQTAMNATWDFSPDMMRNASYNETFHILKEYTFERKGAKLPLCVRGCYPVIAVDSSENVFQNLGLEKTAAANPYLEVHRYSDTQCQTSAVLNLRTYFAVQIATEIAFLVIGIALTKFEIWREQWKKEEDSSGENEGYSLLQYSAKCWEYSYNNWGGSLVEDYLDIGISYAVVVCFGIITPVMALIATVAFMMSYRLRIYRALYVAQRPMPRTSSGIGDWFHIFGYINTVAVVCNGALSALFFYPSRNWDLWKQLLVFVVIEHSVLILRQVVDFIVPDEPEDVARIRHYNEYFKKTIESSDMSKELSNTVLRDRIDLSLNPDNIVSDEDTEGS